MKSKNMFPSPKACLTSLLLFPVFFVGNTSYAAPCDDVPQCQKQEKSSKSYKGWQSRTWAYYCTGEYPYYWDNAGFFTANNNFSWDNKKCFTVTQGEVGSSKWSALITNFCLKTESIEITLGCSRVPQSGASCKLEDKVVGDPKCPITKGTARNQCSGGLVPACVQTWEEQCSDGAQYYCTDDQTVVWCTPCKSS